MRQRLIPEPERARGPRARPAGSVVAVAAGLLVLPGLSGCGLSSSSGKILDQPDMVVTSPAFRNNDPLPVRFACSAYRGGAGVTPPLRWSGAPSSTAAFALLVDDPDASNGVYVHWVIANIDGHTTELVEGARPNGAVEGQNTAGTVGYTAPCPPKGEKPHHYRFTVYALSKKVSITPGASLADSLPKIAALAIGRGRLIGNFGGT